MSETPSVLPEDLRHFVQRLSGPGGPPSPLERGAAIFAARAPGRLDLMGGIADYSGSLVLEMPIAEAACVAVQIVPGDERVIVVSESATDADAGDADAPSNQPRRYEMSLPQLRDLIRGDDDGFAQARRHFAQAADDHWAAYLLGAAVVLARRMGCHPTGGLRVLLRSSVPEAKGVSSSAAVEVATMMAYAAALGVKLEARQVAHLCQVVENAVVGAPCGVMDQMVCTLGRKENLLALRCQPAEVEGRLQLPPGLSVWGIDSGIRHAVSGADYATVRAATFMGYRMIAQMLGLPVEAAPGDGIVRISDTQFGGYLANIPPSLYEQRFASQLPAQIKGAEFLETFGGTTDDVCAIDPLRSYPVRCATAHPIYENHRVQLFAMLLSQSLGERAWRSMGELMYQSHASYSACGLGSEGTDLLVQMVRAAGRGSGLFGAKITGGGSGGTVAVLGSRQSGAAVKTIAEAYAQKTGRKPVVFSESSPGAGEIGSVRIEPQ